jgi:hypothetical protein
VHEDESSTGIGHWGKLTLFLFFLSSSFFLYFFVLFFPPPLAHARLQQMPIVRLLQLPVAWSSPINFLPASGTAGSAPAPALSSMDMPALVESKDIHS